MDIFHKYVKLIKRSPEVIDYYNLALNCCKNILKVNTIYGMKCTKELKDRIKMTIKSETTIDEVKKELFFFYQKVYIVETPYSLDSYFQALEFRRPISEQFYLPRRKQLLPIVRSLEKLLITDELDELFLSTPPRVGKTTLILFALSWQIGMKPDSSNLYCSYSGGNAGSFYKGVATIINDPFTYCWKEIFPDVKFDDQTMCNSKEGYLDTGKIKRFHSITCRSIDGTLNGSCDCSGLLIGDDLISGIEEAMNPSRLISVWQKVDNDFITRAKETAKRLWIGTRWSIKDPIGRRLTILEENEEYKTLRKEVVNIPALDEHDNSNFDYDFGVGFSSTYFKQRRASFEASGDNASWLAQYQGSPIEREGSLFPLDELKFYDGKLPDAPASQICAPIDVGWGGGDFCSCPCLYVYRNSQIRGAYDVYVPAVVFEKGDKYISQPKILNMIRDYEISDVKVEKNNGGQEYMEDIQKMVKENSLSCNVYSKSASTKTSKEARIFASAPDIKLHFYFLDSSKWDKDYRLFMQNLTGYSIEGKNKNDDAPDSLSQGNEMILRPSTVGSYEVFKRPF